MTEQKRKVKMVCTIGPACSDYGTMKRLAEAGMNVARLNFSHGDHQSHSRSLETVRTVEEEMCSPIAVLLDTKGPEIRTGDLKDHEKVLLKSGSRFALVMNEGFVGNENAVYVDHSTLYKEVAPGQNIFIDDGSIHLTVKSVTDERIDCEVLVGGELGEKKGLNVPGADLSVPTLTERDICDINWGVQNQVDYVAVSFVRDKDDIIEVRRILEGAGGKAKVIAKIETRQSVENIDDILDVTDGLMVARGDLGVEMDTETVPVVQKEIIEKCRERGKPVIVATQMLDSMIRNPRPTRAEASDVANAIIDGTDAVMLSGETASGKYPVETVETMHKIVVSAERMLEAWERKPKNFKRSEEIADAVSRAACDIAKIVGATAILSLTRSGTTARMVSKYRPTCPIVAVTPSFSTWRELALVWGVTSLLIPLSKDLEDSVTETIAAAQREGMISAGENVVFTSGVPLGVPGSTNTVHVHTVGKVIGKGRSLVRSRVTGKAVKALTPQQAADATEPGSVLVLKSASREFASVAARASAVITEEDGLTSSVSIATLNSGVPCIVGVEGIFDAVEDGMFVTVDGVHGLVYQGRADRCL
jgi:pyruvate kinase